MCQADAETILEDWTASTEGTLERHSQMTVRARLAPEHNLVQHCALEKVLSMSEIAWSASLRSSSKLLMPGWGTGCLQVAKLSMS